MNFDDETQKQMDRISELAKKINRQHDYDTLNLRCLSFLNKAEFKERKDTDIW